jgi:beta-glucosidase
MKKYLLFALILINSHAFSQQLTSFPFQNDKLSIDQRLDDLIGRLTLDEKIAQMLNSAPAIERLGIPAYDWWSEALHGVARTNYHVTSFPQAIAMAATWDATAIKKMADITSTEGRAVFNLTSRAEHKSGRYQGLTYWTPNINIFRDPRWGRGQETYGEDPFLTATMASAFVHGLQGNDPNHLKAAACAKHFAVHSGPEISRHSDNVNPSLYDLWDTYLPAFRELVVNAKVAGVMCAYNAVNTQPCCANDLLMNEILRRQWKFKGYVTSDCWAVDDFFRYHKTHKDAISSAVDAVIHGTDLECGNSVYRTLLTAVKTGLVSQSVIDSSVRRLFRIRFMLGIFDKVSSNPYGQLGAPAIGSKANIDHALRMAHESIVLLRNENNILPLSKSIRRIAVIGPNADDAHVLLGNYNGTPAHVTTILEGIRKAVPDADIIYEKAISFTSDTIFESKDFMSHVTTDGKPGISASYFPNPDLEGQPLVKRIENTFEHYWNEGESPADKLPGMYYSARFTCSLQFGLDTTLHFMIQADDGFRLLLNDSLIIDAWKGSRGLAKEFDLSLKKNKAASLSIEYYQGEGPGYFNLQMGHFIKTDFNKIKERVKDADIILFAGGISPQLEGEEMPVAVPGFKGGDRTSISVPAVQTELMKKLIETSKPVIFLMLTGSPLAIPWESEHVPVIVNAWYGGQAAGTAVADVLFGNYNPAGRLPVTFYRSDTDLPAFNDYDMSNRTYRYFKGTPLYPFGYGLSFSRFLYSDLSMPKEIRKGQPIRIQVQLQNTSKRDGEEVVEIYVSHQPAEFRAPIRSLKAFQRLFLKAGERRKVTFELTAGDLSLINENGALYQPTGRIVISAGGGQPGVLLPVTSNVISQTVEVR